MADEKWSTQKIKSRIEENELDLSLCGISKVPVLNLLPFTKVTVLDLSCNKINSIPDSFSRLDHLVQIDLSKNALTELPSNFGNLGKLKRLDLFQNHLEELPISFHKLKSLSWLDLKANPIQERLQTIVGDCLKPIECQSCARNVVSYYNNVYKEKMLQKEKELKREQNRLNKLRKEEEQMKLKRKEEKKQRLEEEKRKKATTTQHQDQKQTTSKDSSSVKETIDSNGSCGSWFYLVIFLILIATGIAFVLLHKDAVQIRIFFSELYKGFSRKRFEEL
ncbi:leucine-rich repeat-containing protein 59-like [Clytia hemisphaerica]|uniref:Leucine rich repeat containing protein n=1 Tax=Clytia hemisphaerica TaxID=252671 RepID=A0A7M6DP94_9CNID|eukprot:TCONS_00063679-protein